MLRYYLIVTITLLCFDLPIAFACPTNQFWGVWSIATESLAEGKQTTSFLYSQPGEAFELPGGLGKCAISRINFWDMSKEKQTSGGSRDCTLDQVNEIDVDCIPLDASAPYYSITSQYNHCKGNKGERIFENSLVISSSPSSAQKVRVEVRPGCYDRDWGPRFTGKWEQVYPNKETTQKNKSSSSSP